MEIEKCPYNKMEFLHIRLVIFRMDVLAKMVGTIVADSLKADDEMREMMDINNNPTGEWEKHRK